MKRVLVVVILALGVANATWPEVAASRMSRPDKGRLAFQQHAAGRSASWDAEWRIDPAPAHLGLIVGVAVCGDEAFLLDRQLGVVHRVDLPSEQIVADIMPATGRLLQVTGLVADCDGRWLFVVDGPGVVKFDMDSGVETARFAKPATFVHSLGGAILDGDTQSLYVPGLWPVAAGDWVIKPVDRMFEGHRIGYRLDLQTGRTSPLISALDRGCWSLGPNCPAVSIDAVEGPTGARWIATHRVGMRVGIYDDQFRLFKTVDVRSPLFLENGRRNGSRSLQTMAAWNEHNSVIRRLYAFGDAMVTVHSFNRTRGWKKGRQTDFEVFMNVHTLDGVGLVSDVRLPDLPVGRDATSLYVVDYGPGGRRAIGREPISLLRVPVNQ